MIKPTVGRVVWFHPGAYDTDLYLFVKSHGAEQPMAAIVTHVWSERMVKHNVTAAHLVSGGEYNLMDKAARFPIKPKI